MFVPPVHIQLSVAEIKRLLAEEKAKKEKKAAEAETHAEEAKSPDTRTQSWTQRLSNATSSRKNAGRLRETASSTSSRKYSSPHHDAFARLSFPAFEEPRKAPVPPKHRPRPSSKPVSSPTATTLRLEKAAAEQPQQVAWPAPLRSPPAIPEKSPLRRAAAIRKSEPHGLLSSRPLPFSAWPLQLFKNKKKKKKEEEEGEEEAAPSTKPSPLESSLWSSRASSCRRASSQLRSSESTVNAALDQRRSRTRRKSEASGSTEASFMDSVGVLKRATTAPPSLMGQRSILSSFSSVRAAMLRSRSSSIWPKRARRSSAAHSLDTHLAKIAERREATMHINAAADVCAALLAIDGNAVAKHVRPNTPLSAEVKAKLKRKGEIMSILPDAGFFPVEGIVYGKEKKQTKRPMTTDYHINLPPRLSFLYSNDLPGSPSSIVSTPKDLYLRSPTSLKLNGKYEMSGVSIHRPLSQFSESKSRANKVAEEPQQASFDRPVGVPENAKVSECHWPRTSGIAGPVSTQTEIRGGSIVTGTSSEPTAWKPTVYLHGRIKLVKPAIMPPKTPVTTLEVFEEAVDHMYQEALDKPEWRGDDTTTDDVCEFFDEFQFDDIGFEDEQRTAASDFGAEDVESVEIDGIQRCSSPASEPVSVSSVERISVEEMAELFPAIQPARSASLANFDLVAPPVENEETLRTRGIAWLSRTSGQSLPNEAVADCKVLRASGNLLLLPPQNAGMLDAVLDPLSGRLDSQAASKTNQKTRGEAGNHSFNAGMHSSRKSSGEGSGYAARQHSVGEQGFDWDDDEVEEIDSGLPWVRPKKGRIGKRGRNPVSRMRRFVATASSTIL